jgi:hypothetical protein
MHVFETTNKVFSFKISLLGYFFASKILRRRILRPDSSSSKNYPPENYSLENKVPGGGNFLPEHSSPG